MQVLALALMALAAAGTPLTPAEEDAYFDLDRPFVRERSQLDTFDLMETPDAAAKCAKAKSLTAQADRRDAALTAYLEGLTARNRSVDTLLPFYLATSEGGARSAVYSTIDCAYAGTNDQTDGLVRFADTLLADLPAEPTAATSSTIAVRDIIRRDIWLDEVVTAVEALRDSGAKTPGAQALIGRLDALSADLVRTRQQREDRLGAIERPEAAAPLMLRQVERAARTDARMTQ